MTLSDFQTRFYAAFYVIMMSKKYFVYICFRSTLNSMHFCTALVNMHRSSCYVQFNMFLSFTLCKMYLCYTAFRF